MIVDASALVAILHNEPDALRFATAIEEVDTKRLSAANYLEVAIVIDSKRDPVASARVDDLIRQAGIDIVPVTESQVRLAREAYRAFGKGSGHPARLNFGDCFAYALAKETGQPLLFKGDDFTKAGVDAA
ncbi:MAG: type II toxin-antitoxin system VapC family toxin [Alphaproteobacteria bacterium]|nr:type II toxin-antitoxin system VapC family toxin [Alphaproteobacteria bacterium]